MHHIYAVDRLRAAYHALKRKAAAGVDGETWQSYGLDLEARLLDLSARLARGAYRPQPVRRVYIDKADGSKRPLGVPALEDKLVQLATVEVLNVIYEQDFLGFSYGFRRYQSQPVDRVVELINPVLRGWVNYFAVGHSSECFSFIKDWVEKKIRRHMGRSRNRRGFGWKRWSRRWLYDELKLFNGYRVRRAATPKASPAG